MRLSNNFTYNIKFFFSFIVSSLIFNNPTNSQELQVIKRFKEYCRIVKEDKDQALISIKSVIPNISYDLKYASSQNFTKKKLYQTGITTYLRMPVVLALKKVEDEVERSNYSLKIFDAYRPYSVTKKMWQLIHDERYVANPATGSGHNRGLSVDLTLIDQTTGKEVNMGTDFDNFTDTAHHSFSKLPAEIIKRRKYLKMVMERFGFKSLETEWWHYSWPNQKNYQVMDLSFKSLFTNRCR